MFRVLLLSLFAMPLISEAQTNRFSKLYDENNLWQGFGAAVETSDKNYLLVGVNSGFWWNDFYIWSCTVNLQGDTIVSAKIKSGDSSTYYIGRQAVIRENKHFFMSGSQVEYDNQVLQYSNGYLMKLSEKGERIWQRNYGGGIMAEPTSKLSTR